MKHYLKFVEIKATIKFDCDQDCEKLLETIAVHEYKYEPYTIGHLMNSGFLSPATIHRKIYMLEDAGYISLTYKKPNRRTKYILITKKAEKYLNAIESVM
jgi:DNA-binding MarR family transcriptional regulator